VFNSFFCASMSFASSFDGLTPSSSSSSFEIGSKP
jgi:hypothetical protein